MPTSTSELSSVRAVGVNVTEDELSVDLEDGRTLLVPLAWYPRLLHGARQERTRWQLIGRGLGIHWPELDEDISVEGLLAGRRSGESQASLKRWLERRGSPRTKREALAADGAQGAPQLIRAVGRHQGGGSGTDALRECCGTRTEGCARGLRLPDRLPRLLASPPHSVNVSAS